MPGFKTYRHYDVMDWGPTCLRMVARHYGRSHAMETLRNRSGINREGVYLRRPADQRGGREHRLSDGRAKITWQQLKEQAPLPCIVYWDQHHFVVVYRKKGDKNLGGGMSLPP